MESSPAYWRLSGRRVFGVPRGSPMAPNARSSSALIVVLRRRRDWVEVPRGAHHTATAAALSEP